ncbi:MAG: hypothetical protein H6765_10565 [Candidatus Peribacteria bacterium]|nr:MAG: hypothetical protein H6765_10565 [Candidatus Peribacteria bacterium]
MTAPVPEADEACLTVVTSCEKNCEGTVYATGFKWNELDANTLQVTAQCVSEATCGDTDQWDAIPAELTYTNGTPVSFTLFAPTFTIAGWDGNNKVITVDVAACAPGYLAACIANQANIALEAYDDENAFDNYELKYVNYTAPNYNFTLNSRLRQHFVICELETACGRGLQRTYEITNFPNVGTVAPVSQP